MDWMGQFLEAIDAYVTATTLMPRDPRALAHLEGLLDREPSLLIENPELAQIIKACKEAVAEHQKFQ